MPISPIRFLGLAFASADLLFEVDEQGSVTFAAGAGRRLSGRSDEALVGIAWPSLIAETDRPLGEALLAGASDGKRRGPALVRLAADEGGEARYAALSAFRLPGNEGRVSCALTLSDSPAGGERRDGGLKDREAFEAGARQLIETARGAELELGLVELGGLAARKAALSGAEAEALQRRVAGALRAEAVDDLATELDAERFAVLRRGGDTAETITRRLGRVLGETLKPRTRAFSISPSADPARMMRAIRFALDSFIADELAIAKATSLSDVLDLSVQETVAKAGAFEALVQDRHFELMFQPVVRLADGQAHHHEVLVRFDGERSPYAMIRMAEELDIIESLDRAVTDEAIKRLHADGAKALRLAVNVSGRTIVSSGFLRMIERLATDGDLAGRLMFEVTESAVIADMAVAQNHVQALQRMGFRVCLDDFGAGGASYGYLQQLSVDVVKIDGAYVRELVRSDRDDALIRHMVGLCRELNVETVAEKVETQDVADALRRAGVDYAQGWLFGEPNREPQGLAAPATTRVARRRGAVEQWG